MKTRIETSGLEWRDRARSAPESVIHENKDRNSLTAALSSITLTPESVIHENKDRNSLTAALSSITWTPESVIHENKDRNTISSGAWSLLRLARERDP